MAGGTTTIFLNNPSHSKSYVAFIKGIGEAKTKYEEDRIVAAEADFLKIKLSLPELNTQERRECLIRLIYCEMLGRECTWGHIHAVKFTQSHNLVDKRIGYLAVSLLLHENHELIMLLINTLQKDLKSSNPVEVAMALTVICRLIGPEMIPPLLPTVQAKMLHPKELVRKKAVMAMHHIYNKSPSSVAHLDDDFRRMLGDTDPGVMEAALVLFYQIIKDDQKRFKSLIPTFLEILRSAFTRQLPKEMEYHGVPSPWIQMRLLRILSLLGTDDSRASEQMYKVLMEALSSAECTSSIGLALTYEVIRTITSIFPSGQLIDMAGSCISRFMKTQNNDWKYIGINSLTLVVQVKPVVAQQYQMIVIDCLDDPDETIRRKTLDLMFRMTNPSNVTVITERMISFLRSTTEEFIKKDLVAKITQLAERYSPDNNWFMQTMNEVFELGGSLVRKDVVHNLMRLIAEGTEDEDLDAQLRTDAVTSYLELLDRPRLPDVLVRQICWVVGEYSYVLEDLDQEDILEKMCSLLGRNYESLETISWVITALTKLVSRLGYLPDHILNHVTTYVASSSTDIQQRCTELFELIQVPEVLSEVLPLDASCEDLEVDGTLSFLDGYVTEALQGGAVPYQQPHMRKENPIKQKSGDKATTEFKFEPYAPPPPRPLQVASKASDVAPDSLPHTEKRDLTTPESEIPKSQVKEGLDVKNAKWGRGGMMKRPHPTEATGPDPVLVSEGFHHHGNQDVQPTEVVDTNKTYSSVNGDEEDLRTSLTTFHAEPVMSEEDKKKKALASALFGGVTMATKTGPLSGPGRVPKVKKKGGPLPLATPTTPVATTTSSRPVEVAKQQAQSANDLLLDLDKGQEVENSGSLNTGSSSLTSSTDPYLDLTNPPANHSSLFSGLQGNLSLHGNTSTVQPSVQNTEGPKGTELLSSDLGSVELSGQARPSSLQESSALTMLEENPGIRLSSALEAFPKTNMEDLFQDGVLRVSVVKVFKPKELVIALFFASLRQKEVSLSTHLTATSNLQCKEMAPEFGSTNTFNWTFKISSFSTMCKEIVVVPQGPAYQMAMNGEVHYQNDLAGKRQFFDFPIKIQDLLRPNELTTVEFGKGWKSVAHEKRQKMETTLTEPSDIQVKLKECLNFHPVEVIKQRKEAISAAKFIPDAPCLMHCKIVPASGTLELWLKTNSQRLTEILDKELVLKLK